MSEIKFSKEEKAVIVNKIKIYFHEELNQEIGGFDAEFLLDFFAEELGVYFYNRALSDVHAMVDEQMTMVVDKIYEMEKPLP